MRQRKPQQFAILTKDTAVTDRRIDIEYWQSLGPDAIFHAAWQLVVDAWELKRKPIRELRFDRTTALFKSS
jgi:hypothetical protein